MRIRRLVSSLSIVVIALGSGAVVAARGGMADIAGIWIVQPKSSPGALLSTVTFVTSEKKGLRGV